MLKSARYLVYSRFLRVSPRMSCSVHSATQSSPKPFNAIPRKKGWPVIGTLPEAASKMDVVHDMFMKRYEEFGPIYFENTGLFQTVMICDIDAIQQLLRQEGKYPFRMGLPVWELYRKEAEQALGVLLTQHETWHRMRSVVDKPLMKIRTVESYVDGFNDVATDFVNRLGELRDPQGVVHDIDMELFNWALETIGTVLYQKRMGCVSADRSRETTEFINAVRNMFSTTSKAILYPPKVVKMFMPGLWREMKESWDTIFRVAKDCIDERLDEISRDVEGETSGFIHQILSKPNISQKEAYANITDLMAAAVDTTSNAMHFLMYEVAKRPDVQGRLLEEITSVAPPDGPLEAIHFRECHYLKAVIKETLRLYPVANGISRTLPQDAVILGYHLPAGTMVMISAYVLGRLPSLYTDPLDFKPERWLRSAGTEKINPYAWLAFGVGPRSCIGRRVAEMELQVLVSQMIRRFRLELADDNLELISAMILRANNPIKVRFIDRNP